VLSQDKNELNTPTKPTPSISNELNPQGKINVGIKSTLPPNNFCKRCYLFYRFLLRTY